MQGALSTLPPGLAGYVLADEQRQRQQQSQMGILMQLAQLQDAAANRQLMPMKAQHLQLGVQEAQAKAAATQRDVAFRSPENQARFMTPGVPPIAPDPQEAMQSADYGTPAVGATPGRAPQFDARAYNQAGANMGVTGAQTALNQFDIRDQTRATLAATVAQRDATNQRADAEQTYRNDRHASTEEARVAAAVKAQQDRQDNIRLTRSLIPPPQQGPLESFIDPVTGKPTLGTRAQAIGQTPTTRGTSSIDLRHDQSRATQFARAFQRDAQVPIKSLQSVEAFRNFREQGDNAQSVNMAADALRQASRIGSQRFKGEAEKLLGGGYGGGSLAERMSNFLATEFKGTPSQNTLKRLDGLIGAAEDSMLEQVANQAKFYAAQAKGSKLPLRMVTGAPLVYGSKVVLPDGRFVKMPNEDKAHELANQWLTENP